MENASINPIHVTVLRVIGHAVLVTCAKIDHDGTLYLFDAQGKGIPREEFRESLKLLSPEEVLEGQLVCVRGQRGVVGCVVTPIPEPRSDRHQDLYELRVLNRTSDGQIVEGTATMTRRQVYEFPALFVVSPLNPIETVPASGQTARFVHDMNALALSQMHPFRHLFPRPWQNGPDPEWLNQPIRGFLIYSYKS
ncbi:uncharacterized protein LOC111261135 [Varroa jacobsoni]|uniref:Uncharacterized protein n=1 Tax=Varroa destructor TaxID=109461 RepID=A0A7M7JY69_VARDE|nr:uncharacterized protein LOC111248885 [Varroa destructor]XP_022657819.1 uncharacterized protein LOC111248885 [Varroa destructor]XP_022690134.1 uncharacterized protein LOC111261135 [Varroa jacobsoni]